MKTNIFVAFKTAVTWT